MSFGAAKIYLFATSYFCLALVQIGCGQVESNNKMNSSKMTNAVGVQTFQWQDDTRKGPFGLFKPRTLAVEVWYPAQVQAQTSGTESSYYSYSPNEFLSQKSLEILSRSYSQRPNWPSTAIRNARLIQSSEKLPVIFFSHGAGGMRLQSMRLCTDLARSGFIVVAPDHPGDTMSDLIEIGGYKTLKGATNIIYSNLNRTKDILFVLNKMQKQSPFSESMDLARMGLIGHSHGALSVLRIIAKHKDLFKSAIAQGVPQHFLVRFPLLGIPPLSTIEHPLLLQSGNLDGITLPEFSQGVWEKLERPRAWMEIEKAGHLTFSDSCEWDKTLLEVLSDKLQIDMLGEGCVDKNIDSTVAHHMISQMSQAWFKHTLKPKSTSLDKIEVHLEKAARESNLNNHGSLKVDF